MIRKRLNLSKSFKVLAAASLFTAALLVPSVVSAETIGISIPLSGEASELGRKFRTGAKLAMEDLGEGHEIFIADDGCDSELADISATDLLNVSPAIITGFLCNDVAIHTANALRKTNIPMLIAGARSIRLTKDREREEWNLWRMAPGDDYAYQTAAKFISGNWRDTPFAIVDDGTIFGRTFTDNLRIKLDELGTKEQFSDSFRAAQSTQAGLLRRLERSGVKAAFIAAATTEDLLTIARDMENTGVKLDLLVSEQLSILPFLEDASTIPPSVKVVSENFFISETLITRLTKHKIEPDPQIVAGYAAIQVAIQAINAERNSVPAALKSISFDTMNGQVKFDDQGRNITNPYSVFAWDGAQLVPFQGN